MFWWEMFVSVFLVDVFDIWLIVRFLSVMILIRLFWFIIGRWWIWCWVISCDVFFRFILGFFDMRFVDIIFEMGVWLFWFWVVVFNVMLWLVSIFFKIFCFIMGIVLMLCCFMREVVFWIVWFGEMVVICVVIVFFIEFIVSIFFNY